MSIFTTLRIGDAFGSPLMEVPNYSRYDVTFNCTPGGVGMLETVFPKSVSTTKLLPDGRVGLWRSIDGQPAYHDCNAIFQIRYFDFSRNLTLVQAYHANKLLDRRVIAYSAGSTYTTKTATPADDMIKAFVNENMLAGIVGVDRDGVETQADVSTYLTKEANRSLGASLSKSAARRTLLLVAKEIAEASAQAGTYVTFEIVAPTESTLELRTYAGQRGVDHRASSSKPVILQERTGSFEDVHLIIDYSQERTFIIAAGQGEGTARAVQTSLDTTRMATSPFGRNEDFRDMSNLTSTTSLQQEADSALYSDRPLIYVTGKLVNTPALTRGRQFDLGDMVTALDPQTQQGYDVRLDIIHETRDANRLDTEIGLRSI